MKKITSNFDSVALLAISHLSSSFRTRATGRNGAGQTATAFAETGLLKEWPKDGPKLLWQQKNIGSGYSTPAVVGDRLYLLSNEGLDKDSSDALAKGRQPIWTAPIGKVGNPTQAPVTLPLARRRRSWATRFTRWLGR